MTKMTDSLLVHGHCIKNRIAMLPVYTFSFHGDNGDFYGKQHIEHYTGAAKGGTGLIILQATHVAGASTETAQWTKGSMSALRTIAANAKSYNATVLMQLSYGGDRTVDINKLSTEEVRAFRQEMTAAAIKAHEMGFHGVEFHFAHGFFFCKFLDAGQNQRSDVFGGSVENRVRILTDILPEIRKNTDGNFIVAVRMGLYLPTRQEGIETARLFEKAGIDMLDITFGMNTPKFAVPDDFPFSPVTYSGYIIKQSVNIPVIGVYGIHTEEQVRLLLENDYADMAGIGRGILADSSFANHVMRGESVNLCCQCKQCLWFTDHRKCPAGIRAFNAV
ncbi:NADPH dehydrogenase [Deltaproteobacteria bacterium]|nr:NADPH dehydrogenase [Deltaproteobacteria bacterium]